MRVLLWDLPGWMRDVITRDLYEESRLERVDAPHGVTSLREAVRLLHPDVVVTGPRDARLPGGGFLPVLREWPPLRVIAIGAGRQDTIQVTLIPAEESLGNVSLSSLMGLIAGDNLAVTMQPTRDARSE